MAPRFAPALVFDKKMLGLRMASKFPLILCYDYANINKEFGLKQSNKLKTK